MKKSEFRDLYVKHLRVAVEKHPEDYSWRSDATVESVVDKIMSAMNKNPFGVNYNSRGLKSLAKEVGIKPTRKAIVEFFNNCTED
jgi:transposase